MFPLSKCRHYKHFCNYSRRPTTTTVTSIYRLFDWCDRVQTTFLLLAHKNLSPQHAIMINQCDDCLQTRLNNWKGYCPSSILVIYRPPLMMELEEHKFQFNYRFQIHFLNYLHLIHQSRYPFPPPFMV